MDRSATRRTGRWLAGALIASLVLLLVLVIVGDRMALAYTEQRLSVAVSDAARRSSASPATVNVDVHGFPFLTQLAAGDFTGGTVVLTNVRTPLVRLERVNLELSDVRVPADVLLGAAPHDVTARRVRGAVWLTVNEFASGTGLRGLTLTNDGDRIRATIQVPTGTLGVVTVTGVVRPQIERTRIWLEVDELRAENVPLPGPILDSVEVALRRGVDIPPLPFDVELRSVRVLGDTVRVDVAAEDVPLVS